MLKLTRLRILAVAEMRSCRRLARTWVFIAIAVLACAFWYVAELYSSTLYPSPPSGWVHTDMNPRYTIAAMMNIFVAIFSFGIIFLTFDIQARDIQNRIRDVVDSLPAINIEIIVGRLIGILLLLLIPCALFLALATCYEIASQVVGFRYRVGIQPISIVTHLGWNVIPNLVFYGALVAFLATLVRSRLLVAVIALGALIGSIWITDQIPILYQESLSQYVGNALFPSDLAPVIVTPTIVCSRIAMLLVSIALVLFAASLLPRIEPRRTVHTIIGVTAAILGALVVCGLVFAVHSNENRKEEWLQAHRQLSPSAFPDIEQISGTIELYPGRKVALDVTLTLIPPLSNTTDSVIFSLNPGYKVQEIFVDGEAISDFMFNDGLLKVAANLFMADSHEIRIQAQGKPDDRFAYLDQVRDFQKLSNANVRTLGLRNSIFHSDFVALMPGNVWYPISGTMTNRDDLEHRRRDLFTADLTISVPRQWQVAMVGQREAVENLKRNMFRFKSGAHVPELALLASNFDQRTMNIEGVGFEVLFSKKHLQNLDVLAPITDQIQQWVAERINNARALSLGYPYGMFYVVEVPSHLRIYGGGVHMDTVLQPPGMMLIRETTFPTAPFELILNEVATELEHVSEDEQHEKMFADLLEYFERDLQGGSPFADFARNFVSHQVSATQRGAPAVQYVLDQLSNQLITQIESGSIISLAQYGTGIRWLGIDQSLNYYQSSLATRRRMGIASLPSTWDYMDEVALFDLEFSTHPVLSHRVLLTKGHALAKTMIAHYGTELIGVFLEQLLSKYRGQNFTLEELLEVASAVGIDLHEWVLPWLADTVLPGYLTATPNISKLEASELGDSEFQTTFMLHNAESIPGMVHVMWSEDDVAMYRHNQGQFKYSDPIFVAGNQTKRIAIQSANRLTGIWIEPFLAQNRTSLEVLLPEYNEDNALESQALPFISDVDWQPPESEVIVVDDLDPGFSIVSIGSDAEDFSFAQRVLRFSTPTTVDEYDQGLRLDFFPVAGEWLRQYGSSSFGYYRRTHARIAHGNSSSAARFETNLPRAGTWRLDFFLTKAAVEHVSYMFSSQSNFWGTTSISNRPANSDEPAEHYRLEIRDGQNEWKKQFDIANASEGWNEVGKFDLSTTDIEVFLSDWAGHKDIMVHADAIRWIPVDSE